ncbi:MAG: hypothetical protein ACXWC4_20090 [Telluria sp.]
MKHHFTPAQVKMLVARAERQLEQVIDDSARHAPGSKHIAVVSRAAFDEAVVSLIRLFREHVDGAAGVATLIAREYANGADAQSRCTTVECACRILDIARAAHERYLVPAPSGEAAGPASRRA